MKFLLLRYNSTPIKIDANNIESINADNSVLVIVTKDKHTYVGYQLSPIKY